MLHSRDNKYKNVFCFYLQLEGSSSSSVCGWCGKSGLAWWASERAGQEGEVWELNEKWKCLGRQAIPRKYTNTYK